MATPAVASMFKKAERKKTKIKLLITGVSGSGKTYSALLIAKGLGKRIAVIDTENGSSESYAGMPGMPEFDVVTLKPPYLTSNYLNAMRAAQQEGYDVVIVDSLTHQWKGEGSILHRKEQMDSSKSSANTFTSWAKFSPEHDALISAILHFNTHLIATTRSKTEYALEKNDQGKIAPVKVGLAPVQRDGLEYEFTCVFDIDKDTHKVSVSKDRTSLFDGKYFVPTEETGVTIGQWVQEGADVAVSQKTNPFAPPASTGPVWKMTTEHITQLNILITDKKKPNLWDGAKAREYLVKRFGKTQFTTITKEEYDHLCDVFKNKTISEAFDSIIVPPAEAQSEFDMFHEQPIGQGA